LRWGVALAVGYRDIAWVLAPLQAAVDLIAWVVWLVTVVWLPLVRAAPWVAVAVLWQLGRTHGTVPGHAPRHSANLAGGDLETLAAHPHVTEHPLSQTSSTLSGSVAVILPLGGAAMTGQSDWTASTKVTVVLTALGVLVAALALLRDGIDGWPSGITPPSTPPLLTTPNTTPVPITSTPPSTAAVAPPANSTLPPRARTPQADLSAVREDIGRNIEDSFGDLDSGR
jgi:hypothetical protein